MNIVIAILALTGAHLGVAWMNESTGGIDSARQF